MKIALKSVNLYEIVSPFGAVKNCRSGRYFTSSWRGIGISFQLAIIAPRLYLIGYDIATALIYISSAPVLTLNSTEEEYVLNKHTVATYDSRESESKLIVTFKVEDSTKLTLKFRFEMDAGYWIMPKVDVFLIDTKSNNASKTTGVTLEIDGDAPYAPMGSSYSCSKQLVFRNGSTILTLENIQVQPALDGSTKFGSAWDCIGFTTVPIWSGLFVTSFMAIGLAVAICAILDIKPPNRFESRTGKQLTFTVQE